MRYSAFKRRYKRATKRKFVAKKRAAKKVASDVSCNQLVIVEQQTQPQHVVSFEQPNAVLEQLQTSNETLNILDRYVIQHDDTDSESSESFQEETFSRIVPICARDYFSDDTSMLDYDSDEYDFCASHTFVGLTTKVPKPSPKVPEDAFDYKNSILRKLRGNSRDYLVKVFSYCDIADLQKIYNFSKFTYELQLTFHYYFQNRFDRLIECVLFAACHDIIRVIPLHKLDKLARCMNRIARLGNDETCAFLKKRYNFEHTASWDCLTFRRLPELVSLQEHYSELDVHLATNSFPEEPMYLCCRELIHFLLFHGHFTEEFANAIPFMNLNCQNARDIVESFQNMIKCCKYDYFLATETALSAVYRSHRSLKMLWYAFCVANGRDDPLFDIYEATDITPVFCLPLFEHNKDAEGFYFANRFDFKYWTQMFVQRNIDAQNKAFFRNFKPQQILLFARQFCTNYEWLREEVFGKYQSTNYVKALASAGEIEAIEYETTRLTL